jgi:uncharacterized protein YndB with AHSA1/START domain
MAQPVDIDVTREMKSSPDAIWAVLDDLKRLPEWLAFAASLEDVSSDRAVEGATYTVKPGGAFEPKTHWKIVTVEERRRQVHASEMPMLSGVTSTLELQAPDGGPASVHVHWHGEPKNLFGRMMRGMFQKRIDENWRKSLEALDSVAGGG